MRDSGAIVRFETRRRLRTGVAALLAAVATLAVAASYLLPGGVASRDGGAALESAAAALALVCGLVASGAAASHPEDRASGVAPWIRATGLPEPVRRVAPAAAAAALALAAGVAGGALVGVLGETTGLSSPARVAVPLAVEGPRRLTVGASDTTTVVVREPDGKRERRLGARGELVELDLRPVFRDLEAAARGTTRLLVGGKPLDDVPVRGAFTIATPERRLAIAARDPQVDLRVVAARRLGTSVPFVVNALLLGALVGLALASGAPLAAFLSRGTSAATAAIATGTLLVVGLAREGLLELAAGADAVAGGSAAGAVMRAAILVAPDLSALDAISGAAAGRAVDTRAFLALAPAALHALVTTSLLALLPVREPRA